MKDYLVGLLLGFLAGASILYSFCQSYQEIQETSCTKIATTTVEVKIYDRVKACESKGGEYNYFTYGKDDYSEICEIPGKEFKSNEF